MNRRRFLRVASAGTVAGIAGCASNATSGQSTEEPTDEAGTETEANAETDTDANAKTDTETQTEPQSVGDVELPVPEDELQRGAARDAIPAIVDPRFDADWTDITIRTSDMMGDEYEYTPSLTDGEAVIGVVRESEARAYPLAILNWHEVVNDDFHGPLLVTFCPLCGSGVTAERTVGGEETIFGVSGLLWKSDLVMYDRSTDSLWSQIMATAIRGPKTGETLSLVPSTLTTWGEWREEHPHTEVLLPPPESGTIVPASPRDYNRNPYDGYESIERIGIGSDDFDDDRMHPKTTVIGVQAGDVARAYSIDAVRVEDVINDEVGDLPVVVTVTTDGSLVAYDRRVEGETLTFEADGPDHLSAGGSRWERLSGDAIDGPHEGTTLDQVNDRSPMFWFAWLDFHPDTDVYGE